MEILTKFDEKGSDCNITLMNTFDKKNVTCILLCAFPGICSSNICNLGLCYERIDNSENNYICVCPSGIAGYQCEKCKVLSCIIQ